MIKNVGVFWFMVALVNFACFWTLFTEVVVKGCHL